MMQLKPASIAILILTLALPQAVMAHAWINGVWKGTITEGKRSEDITIEIDGESNSLFGTVSGKGWESPFKSGFFDDSRSVTFSTQENHDGRSVQVFYDGTVHADRIEFERHISGSAKASFTVRRPKGT
jgi:hypothetical protein